MVEDFPFIEFNIGSNRVIRKFTENTAGEELLWHWDEEDRIVENLHPTDWQFQFDNKLPQPLEGKISIPKGVWHRLIKGTGEVNIVVEKIYN